jgi:Icc-related predicted phosphoesterase
MSGSRMRIAVITDLHYVLDTTTNPSSYRPQMANGQTFDPIERLGNFLTANAIKANVLLCPGDITNQAAHAAFIKGWENLKTLRDKLCAVELIAVTGNHEVDSRASESMKTVGLVEETVDPIGLLQSIEDYPASFLKNPDQRWIYWGRGYEIIEDDDAVIVLINSCHFHITMQPNEYERGKISQVVLDSFKKRVTELASSKKFRIVLMHHHPISQHDTEGSGQIDMYNGSKLMEILNESYNDWLIIHGHKHDPRLIRAQGAATPPIVFSAGSFGAALSGALATKTKNQFYILELESIQNVSGTLEMRGRIEAYYWTSTEWRPAIEDEHGLPNGCGFANNVNIDEIATDVRDHLQTIPGSFMKWTEICEVLPALNYLMPFEIKKLRYLLGRLKVNLGGDSRLSFPTELSL